MRWLWPGRWRPTTPQMVLVNAFPYEDHPTRGSVTGYEEILREESMAILTRASHGDGTPALRAVANPSPARALHRVAADEQGDLIVVGSCHHQSAVGRVILGDVARATLHAAPCAVAVAPRGFAQRSHAIRTVAVGFNASREARAALDFAHQLAQDSGAELRLLSAVSVPAAIAPFNAYAYDWASLEKEMVKAARDEMGEATAGFEGPVTIDAVRGIAADELEKLSASVDLMVVGSRGWGAARRVGLGSTADRLVHHAHCPVIAVPRPEAADEEAAPAPRSEGVPAVIF